MSGPFVSLEGSDGAGKSVNAHFIADWFASRGREVVMTREPGGSRFAEAIRALLLDPAGDDLGAESEVLAIFAARSHHLREVIRPALASGKVVVCDRFTDATVAYQCGGRGYSQQRVLALAEWVHSDCWPNLTLLLTLPLEVGIARNQMTDKRDRFELETLAFKERVRQSYLALQQASPERICAVDASRTLAEVQHDIADLLSSRFADE
ncbi:dTMP kinase [Gammaproteobacteria bacterium]|nr:dTMP kinase [Gammaproteobacteria bacterium]